MSLSSEHLNTLVMVVRRGSMAKAAEHLGLTIGAVSQRIDALEAYFDASLLIRQGRGSKLTEEGRLVYDGAEEVLLKLSDLKTQVQEMQKSPKGMVRIEASTIPGEHIIPLLISSFKDRYPGVDFLVRVSDSQVAFKKLFNGEVDLAVVGSLTLAPKDLSFEKVLVGREKLVLITPPSHGLAGKRSVSIRELASSRLIFREKGSGTRAEAERLFAEAGLDPSTIQVHMQLGSTESIITAVSGRAGVSIVSEIAAKKAAKAGLVKMTEIKGAKASRGFYLIRNTKRPLSRPARLFWGYCQEKASKIA